MARQSVVLLLSTNSDSRTDGSVTRKTGKGNEEIEIACPQAVINYTKHMGGVDVSDQKHMGGVDVSDQKHMGGVEVSNQKHMGGVDVSDQKHEYYGVGRS